MDFSELSQYLNATKNAIKLTHLTDANGYSAIQFSASKNMVKATEVLIDFMLRDDFNMAPPKADHGGSGETRNSRATRDRD